MATYLCFLMACCAGSRDAPDQGCLQDAAGCRKDDARVDYAAEAGVATHPCDFAALAGITPQPPRDQAYQVGDFQVLLVGGALTVHHPGQPDRALFSTPSKDGFLRAEQRAFELRELQGSVTATDTLLAACRELEVASVVSQAGMLTAVAGFGDAADVCRNLAVELRLCQPLDGHLYFAFELSDPAFNAIVMRSESQADERIYGLGEQFTHETLNLKGREIPVVVSEGGVGRGLEPVSTIVNSYAPGSAGSEASTYFPMPHFVTNRMRSFLLENMEYSVFDFSEDEQIEVRVQSSCMTGRIMNGTNPLEHVERLTEYTGRMSAPPEWVHRGAIVALARPLEQSLQLVDELQSAGAMISAVWNQTWSGTATTWMGEQVQWNWVLNSQQHPGWTDYRANLEARDIKLLCYVNPMLRDLTQELAPTARNLFQEATKAGYFVTDAAGDDYLLRMTAFEVGLLDLTNPGARTWMKGVLLEEMLQNAGCAGWMVDFAEGLPFDALLFSGQSPYGYHNRYPVDWIRLNRDAVNDAGGAGEILLFNRSGFTGSTGESMLLWEGDQLTTWDEYDGLTSAVHGLLNGGFSGLAINHSDAGGYTSLSAGGQGVGRGAELLQRWVECSAFTAVLRTHEGNQPEQNIQVYSDAEVMAHFARFTRVYAALASYRLELVEEAVTRGWPIVRHLAMHYPDDEQAWLTDDQFLLGREFLVAPVLTPCAMLEDCPMERELYLPPGGWTHLWSGLSYGTSATGTWVTVPAPLGEPAVFFREGGAAGEELLSRLWEMGVM